MASLVVGTALHGIGKSPYRGFVDLIDPAQGVRGWVVNLEAPLRPVRLELMVGEVVLGEAIPDQLRNDISDALGETVHPGFTFDAATLALVIELAEAAGDILSVRVGGTDFELGTATEPVTAGQMIKQIRSLNAPSRRNNTADFELLLEDLRNEAVPLAEEALRPIPENVQGYIETLAIDTSGQVWMIGWMRRGHLTEFSAVISERRKIPAACVLMTFTREDLPPDACGVIGLLSSAWRPNSATGEFYLFFGNNGRYHLRAHAPMRYITPSELVSEYENVAERLIGEGRAIALQRMLTSLESWLPTRATGQTYGVETSIDRVLLIPGLGCLVEGWVLSPMKRVESMRLRVGGAVMTSQSDATYFKPRPDLLAAFPGSNAMVARAGFVSLFAGDGEPEDVNDPMLKLIFEGSAAANFAVPSKVFRRLGHSGTLEDALMFFPALEEEPFFPRFADAAMKAQRAAMNPPVPITTVRTRHVMIFVLPEDRCDLFLMFEELSQQCRAGHAPEGVAFVAAARANRTDALWLFRDFQSAHAVRASLLVIDDVSHAFALLPDILREVGANRFVFVGPGAFLTPSGWQKAREALAGRRTDLVFLGLEPDPFEPRDLSFVPASRCFAWTTGMFLRWSLTAPVYLGGFHKDNGLARADVAHIVHSHAARISRTLQQERIHDAVNTEVYAVGAQG